MAGSQDREQARIRRTRDHPGDPYRSQRGEGGSGPSGCAVTIAAFLATAVTAWLKVTGRL